MRFVSYLYQKLRQYTYAICLLLILPFFVFVIHYFIHFCIKGGSYHWGPIWRNYFERQGRSQVRHNLHPRQGSHIVFYTHWLPLTPVFTELFSPITSRLARGHIYTASPRGVAWPAILGMSGFPTYTGDRKGALLRRSRHPRLKVSLCWDSVLAHRGPGFEPARYGCSPQSSPAHLTKSHFSGWEDVSRSTIIYITCRPIIFATWNCNLLDRLQLP